MGNDMDWKKWALKGAKRVIVVAAVAGLTELGNFIGATEFPAAYAAIGGVAVILIEQATNYVKHSFLAD